MTTTVRRTTPSAGASADNDEAPVQVSGVLDARSGQAFLRTSGYQDAGEQHLRS
jgi:hypothetical protein